MPEKNDNAKAAGAPVSGALARAREYEERAEKLIGARPLFHFSPRAGWLNDPNGLSFYQGKYHLFYQYHPYDSHWGPMHWGHAVTQDFLHWEYLPAAMAPDTPADRDGCFSGSAITLEDGRHLLMYTGCRDEKDELGKPLGVQVQCMAVGDGLNYEKYEGNPVLTEKDLPEGGSRYDFRDPKIFRASDGTYRAVVGNRPADDSGQILLFESPDAFHWSFKSVLAQNRCRFGRMWECPDFFPLGDKWVLITSPQDMFPQDFEYHNGNGTLCLIGDYEEEKGTFTPESDQAIDYGIDFYAPQTILTQDGRRLMIAWMQNPDTSDLHLEHRTWFGQMTIARELFLKDGRLCQAPARELCSLRGEKVSFTDQLVEGELTLPGIRGRGLEMELEVTPCEGEEDYGGYGYKKFTVQFAANESFHTNLSFRPLENTLKIDRKFSGSRRAIIHQRRAKIQTPNKTLKLHIILDRYSAEVFVGDGEQVLTATLYTDLAAEGIRFLAHGRARMNVTKWELIP